MTRKCRCCNGDLDIESPGPATGAVTDGLCSGCTANRGSREGVNLQEFIDTLIVPTLVVDQKGSIQTVNEKARSLFRYPLAAMMLQFWPVPIMRLMLLKGLMLPLAPELAVMVTWI